MKKNYFIIYCLLALFMAGVAGCKKDAKTSSNPASANINNRSSIPDSMMITPEGLMPRSHVHLIEKGYSLQITNGHVIKINTLSGKVMEDLGKIKTPVAAPLQTPSNPPLNRSTRALTNNSKPPLFYAPSPNWQTNAQWQNTNTSQPITKFSTNYTVPGQPVNPNDSQVISIWEGVSQLNMSDIMQPVLAWGGEHMTGGGGNYWTVANWYVWSDAAGNEYAAYTAPVEVNSGTPITGLITLNSETNGSYNYTVQFNGCTNNPLSVVMGDHYDGVTIPTVPQEVWAVETLECYNYKNGAQHDVYQLSDYPQAADVQMTGINILTGGSLTSPIWAAEIGSTAFFGEHTYIVPGNGEVDLYYKTLAPVITYPTPDVEVKGLPMSFGPTNTGGAIVSYAITPALPAGLSLDPGNGFITGTPTTTSPSTPYKVTATNTGGSSSFTFNMTINAPQVAINGTATYAWSHSGSGSGTITATAGTLVGLDVAGFGPGNSVNFSLSGAQLSPPATSSNNVTVNNNDIAYTFVMPASGSVNWSATYTTPTGGGAGNIAPYVVEPPNANINGHTNYKWTSGGTGSGTITAPAGQLVYITFNAESTALSVNFTLTGATLSGPTGNTIFVSDNYVVQSFTMPSSGTVSWTGTFTPGTGQGEIDVN